MLRLVAKRAQSSAALAPWSAARRCVPFAPCHARMLSESAANHVKRRRDINRAEIERRLKAKQQSDSDTRVDPHAHEDSSATKDRQWWKAELEHEVKKRQLQDKVTPDEPPQSNGQSDKKRGKADGKADGKPDPDKPNYRVVEIKLSMRHLLIGFAVTAGLFFWLASATSGREITFQQFKTDYLNKGRVKKLIVVNKALVRVVLDSPGPEGFEDIYFTIGSVDSFEEHMAKAQDAIHVPVAQRVPIAYVDEGGLANALLGFAPTVLLLGFLLWMTRRSTAGGVGGGAGGMFGFGKSTAKLYNKITDVKVKFDDVAGMDEAKEEIMEFVKFLKDPKHYEELGAKIPRGAILSGPPGTGKTLVAKATAGEAGVPFFSVSGSEFIEMFAGVGASRVRDLFKEAKAKAPSIIFIDEIDAIGKSRSKAFVSGGHDEREATLNQLLVEMDGFESNEHVVVLAGTNRPDVLDAALLRPGRFDRHIHIDIPDISGRIEIFKVHLAKIVYDKAIYELPGKLAAMTPGFSGADIANVCNEAALVAARQEATQVELKHFEQAIDRVIAGIERKSRVLTPDKKKVVAYHEAGHAVCGWFLKYADPLVKVSIIPHGAQALGYAQYLPPDQYLLSEEQFADRMAMTLGGRVSEELNFDCVTLGGSDDFRKVTQMARAMVTIYGMSPKIGEVFIEKNRDQYQNPYSEETGKVIDEEIRRIVKAAHERCKQLLTEKHDAVDKVAQLLLDKEVLDRSDMIRLLGARPFPERNDAFDKYLEQPPSSTEQPSAST